MIKTLLERWRQGHRTIDYPRTLPKLSDRFRGRPLLFPDRCGPACTACQDVCPTEAIYRDSDGLALDIGRCLFCGACQTACPAEAIVFSDHITMAARRREDLILRSVTPPPLLPLDDARGHLLSRSLKLRQVSAGGCNACEADLNVLGTVVFDLGRFGIDFTASPRHADGVVVTGPVTVNMRDALLWTWEATPEPKVAIAVGACAIAGGPYAGFAETESGCTGLMPVDLFIPGCPPHPLTILDGLLRLLGRQRAAERSK